MYRRISMRLTRRRLGLAAAIVTATGSLTAVGAVSAQAATGCQVSYAVTNQWPGGFGANVTVTNLGDAINGWRLTWSFAAGQTITQLWNGTAVQAGANVTVTNVSWNSGIPTGGNVGFGFNGAWNGSN